MMNYAIVVGVIISILVVSFVFVKRKRSDSWFCKFYSDKLIYNESFVSKKVKEIKYSEIKEIRYNQSFLQSKFNLGEIYIQTNNRNIIKKVIVLKFIPNVKKEYEKIVNMFNT